MRHILTILLCSSLLAPMAMAQTAEVVADSVPAQTAEQSQTDGQQTFQPNPYKKGTLAARIYEKKTGMAPQETLETIDSTNISNNKSPYLTFWNGCTVDLHGGMSVNHNYLVDDAATNKNIGWYVAVDLNIPLYQVKKWTFGMTGSILFVGKYFSAEYNFEGGTPGLFAINEDLSWIERPVYMEYTVRGTASRSFGDFTIMPGIGFYAGVGIGGYDYTYSYSHITKIEHKSKNPYFGSSGTNRGDFGLDLDLQLLYKNLFLNIEGEISFINFEKNNKSRSSRPSAFLLGIGWRF